MFFKFRKSSFVIGICFLAATISFMIGDEIVDSVFLDKEYLVIAGQKRSELLIAAGITCICGFSVVGTATFIYPILMKQSRAMSLWYICLRAVEMSIIFIYAISALLMVDVSHGYVQSMQSSSDQAVFFLTLGNMIKSFRYYGLRFIIFLNGISGTSMCASLLLLKLNNKVGAPFWLSSFGVFAYGILLPALLCEFGGIFFMMEGLGMLTVIPGAIFEVVFPIYLFYRAVVG